MRRLAGALALALSVAAPGGGWADIAYEVEIVGVEDRGLAEALRESSRLIALTERPPATEAAMQRRIDEDLEGFKVVLRAYGHFDGGVVAEVRPPEARPRPEVPADGEEPEAPPEEPKTRVIVTIEPGPPYLLEAVDLETSRPDSAAVGLDVPLEALGLRLGEPARSAEIRAAERALANWLGARGFPLAEVRDRRLVVDHARRTVRSVMVIETGPKARFGEPIISGAPGVDRDYLLRRLPWTYGDSFDTRRLDRARKTLAATGIFGSIAIEPSRQLGPDGLLPVEVKLVEGKPRTIGAGAHVTTGEGVGARAFWTHRNLFGGAERLDLSAEVGTMTSAVDAYFRKPDVLRTDQDLLLAGGTQVQETDAFDARSATASARLERRLTEALTVGYGVAAERLLIDEDAEEEDFDLIGLPLTLSYDKSDSLLDPTSGGRTVASLTPFLEELGSTVGFTVLRFSQTGYLPLDRERKVVLAGRLGYGSIFGPSTNDIPASHRLYAGGSGSLRAYAFQHAGPLDQKGNPEGGRSLLEGSLELRWRVAGDIAIVPFLEAGNVYDESIPRPTDGLLWGAGLGLRYHTAVGPIRVDVATPLDRREEDRAVQFYISIGQAF